MDAYQTDTMERLIRARELAWARLRPAFDHAIAIAREAEYQGAQASISAEAGIAPAYPVLVTMLAESVVTAAEVPF